MKGIVMLKKLSANQKVALVIAARIVVPVVAVVATDVLIKKLEAKNS